MKFRTRLASISAIQWTGNLQQIREFVGDALNTFAVSPGCTDGGALLIILEIKTLEGTMRASDFDWIIKGTAGEFYLCKDYIFHTTYEPVEESV